MSLDPQIARLQARLLQGLADGTAGADLRAEVAGGAPDDVLCQWAADWDDDLLELAGVLVRTWARRAPD